MDINFLQKLIIGHTITPLTGTDKLIMDVKVAELVDNVFDTLNNNKIISPQIRRAEMMKLIFFDPTNSRIYDEISTCYRLENMLEEANSFCRLALMHKK